MSNEIIAANEAFVPVNTGNRFSDDGFNLVADVTTATLQYTSMKPTTNKEKAELFNAMNNPDGRLADCINMKLKIKDLYIEIVDCVNDETGESVSCPRIVLITDQNKSYACVSVGIYSALKKLIQLYGEPTWDEPITIEVKQITKGKKQMLTLNAVA